MSRVYQRSELGLKRFIKLCTETNAKTVLDIGCGEDRRHSDLMSAAGLSVETNDFFPNADHIGVYTDIDFNGRQFDAIWASHVLEHQLDVQKFLRKTHKDLKESGVLCITVPPLKHKIVGGHLNLFNLGLLMYHLIVAGYDLKHAYYGQYGYNISIVVQKKSIENFPILAYDSGDIDKLAPYFPFHVSEKFEGDGLNMHSNL